MQIAIVGDTHFEFHGGDEFLNRKMGEFFTKQFFSYMEANNIKTMVHLGDLFNNRKKINMLVASIVTEYFFHPIYIFGYNFIQLIGNHDAYYNDTNRINSPLNFLPRTETGRLLGDAILSHPKNINIVSDFVNIGQYASSFAGWGSKIPNATLRYLFCHYPIIGFEYQNGIINKKGFKVEDFRKFDLVFSGHFHKRAEKENIIYVGSPLDLNFGEADFKHGFYVLETETGEYEFIESKTKLFNKFLYDEDQPTPPESFKDQVVKIITTKVADEKKFDIFKAKVEEHAYKVHVTSIESEVKNLLDEEEVKNVDDLHQIIRQWFKNNDEGLKQEIFLKMCDKIYKEAQL